MKLRRCNLLWWEDVDSFSNDDLELLKYAFEVGFIPLGDEYGDHNEKWVKWKSDVMSAIQRKLT